MNNAAGAVYELKGLVKKILFHLRSDGFKEYHHFPFDTYAAMPSSATDDLDRLLSILEAKKLERVRISDGTLLGLAREGALIKHDTDLDFDVIDTPEYEIRTLAEEQGWVLGREVRYNSVVQQLTYYNSSNLIIDFVFWYANGKFAVNYSERNYMRVQPLDFFIETEIQKFGGTAWRVPSDLNGWLEYRYGKSWCIPAGAKGDWKAECGDLIYIGR